MEDFLGFVDFIGRTIDGKYIYRFDFTTDIDTIWGEYFNVTPAGIIPNLQADKNALSRTAKVIFPREMAIAKKNYCFSMQDCIDGIIPLIFSEIDECTLEYADNPFFIRFGESFDEVKEKLEKLNLEILEIEEVKRGDDSAIDALISDLDDESEDDDEDDDFNF
jgi:hypothetical protein